MAQHLGALITNGEEGAEGAHHTYIYVGLTWINRPALSLSLPL